MNRDELIVTVKTMIAAPSCCQELKEAGQKWLNAIGSDGEKSAAEALIAEIKSDITPIDHVIEFFSSPRGIELFGAEKAKAIADHAREVKAADGKWCDCPACSAGLKILENAQLLK